MANGFNYFADIFVHVDGTLSVYVSDVSSKVISSISPVATQLFILYVILWGWVMMRGMVAEPVTDGAARILKIAIILGLALSAGRYNGYVADHLYRTPDALGAVVTGRKPDGVENLRLLDQVLTEFFQLGSVYWENASIAKGNVGLYFIALLTWAFGVACTAYAAFLILLAKIALVVLLALGPIFILSIMFDATKRFFESWLGLTLNFVFLSVLAVAVIKLMLTLIGKYTVALQKAVGSGTVEASQVMHVFPVILIALVAVLILRQTPAMAASLGGGLQLSTLGAMGWAISKTRNALGSLRPTRLERSYLRTNRDLKLTRHAARAVGRLPVTAYRKLAGRDRNRVSKNS